MEIALYVRVSTNEQQTLPMQLKAMRDYAKNVMGCQTGV